jgi:hypothetical protein
MTHSAIRESTSCARKRQKTHGIVQQAHLLAARREEVAPHEILHLIGKDGYGKRQCQRSDTPCRPEMRRQNDARFHQQRGRTGKRSLL